MNEPVNPFQYNGSSGAISRQTSLDREAKDRYSGETQARANRFMAILKDCGLEGATYKEMQTLYKAYHNVELHHGQISGLLSTMHKDQQIFMSHLVRRNGCFAYIHNKYKDLYADYDRFDSPVQTNAGIRKQALEKVLAELRELDGKQDRMFYGDYTNAVEDILRHFDRAVGNA